MKTDQRYAFSLSPGKDIYLFTLRNSKGTEVRISNYGAIISSFRVRARNEKINDIVLGFDNIEDYLQPAFLEQYPWFGCVVGRYANRIRNASFGIDGKNYQLSKNQGDHQLHGGFSGFDKKIWSVSGSGEKPWPFLELHYRSENGEEGYPGNLDTWIRYELNGENEFSYEFRATTDQPTPVNLTHHSYFNLNNGKGTIHDHKVKIHASSIMEQDKDLVATGEIVPVTGTVYDLREFYPIGDGLKKIPEYDKSFVINNKPEALSPVAELMSESSGILLQIHSTEPVVHFYTGKWIPVVTGKNGTTYGPFSGLCLETHKHPNALNTRHFPNTILRPGEIYYQKTVYKLGSVSV